MTDLLSHAPYFILGWAACISFQFAVAWLAGRRQPEPLHEFESHNCPWPVDAKFPHRLQGVSENHPLHSASVSQGEH